jgi:hypothetical protein
MLKNDQSYFFDPTLSDSANYQNRELRKEIFKENLKDLILFTELIGFPTIESKYTQQDSCRYWAISGTLIHNAQANKDVFFSKPIIDIFKREIKKGNLKRDILYPAIKLGLMGKVCDSLHENVLLALESWNFNDFLPEVKTKSCN